MLKAPFTMIWVIGKQVHRWSQDLEKMPGSKKRRGPVKSKTKKKILSSQTTDLHCHAIAYHLWEELLKEQ